MQILKQIIGLWLMGKFLKQQSIYRHTEKRKRNQIKFLFALNGIFDFRFFHGSFFLGSMIIPLAPFQILYSWKFAKKFTTKGAPPVSMKPVVTFFPHIFTDRSEKSGNHSSVNNVCGNLSLVSTMTVAILPSLSMTPARLAVTTKSDCRPVTLNWTFS